MGELYPCKPDSLFEHDNLRNSLEFVFEIIECEEPDPYDFALKDEVLTKIIPTKSRQNFLDESVFSKSKLSGKLSGPDQTEAMNQVLNDPKTQLRLVFFTWMRPELDPNAEPSDPLDPDDSFPGKQAPNGNQFWGATLFDFYYVTRLHDQPIISTGSKLAKWAKVNNETHGPAKAAIRWAEDEDDPELIPPHNIQLRIERVEEDIRQHIAVQEQKDQGECVFQPDRWALPKLWPPKSVFEPEAYPKGWPTQAFIDDKVYGFNAAPILQHYIPQHCLPEKLVVHDPGNVLWCKLYDCYRDSPTEDADRKVTYRLELSEKYADRRKADEDKAAAEEAHAKKILESFLTNPHSSLKRPSGFEVVDLNEPGWTKPALFVVFPPRPPLKRPEEAHVHLSTSHLMGKGNHSRVYHAEMVVPRSWLMDEVMCIDCVKEDVKKLLDEEDGLYGERRLKKWDEKTGMVVRHEIRKRHKSCVKEWEDIGAVRYVLQEAVAEDVMTYEGPYRVVHTRVEYQNLERGPLCVHMSKGMAHLHPLTTKVGVAAKLTVKYDIDMHRKEADNYQRFPKHFFEHWSGFNICPPMNAPVPVGPVVPQFYGYYVPEDAAADEYQSPILLIEKCGIPIEAEELSVDDRHECLSLGLRMNAAGWYHGSFFERNIVIQAGPLHEPPSTRKKNQRARDGYGINWSFRVIDFGRSRHMDDPQGTSSRTSRNAMLTERNEIKNWWRSGTTYWG